MRVRKPARLAILSACLAVMGLAGQKSGDASTAVPRPAGRSALSDYVASQYAQSSDNLPAASAYVAAVLKSDPSNPVLLRRAFELNLGAGNFQVALPLAERLYAQDKSDSTAALVLMAAAVRANRTEEARRYLANLAENGVEGFLTPVIRAWLAQGEGHAVQVDGFLSRLESVPAFRSYAREHAGYLALAAGQPAKAVAELSPLVADQAGGGMRIRTVIAAALSQKGDKAGAQAMLEAGRDLTTDPLVDALLIELSQKGRVANPVATPRQGIGQLFLRAGIDLSRDQATPLALVLLRLATYLTPDFDDSWLALADVLAQAGQHTAALTALSRIPEASPLAAEARLAMARLHQGEDRTEQALATLDSVLTRSPRLTGAVILKADILRQQEKYGEARPLYDRALEQAGEKSPSRWLLLYMRGICWERLNEWPRAEADFRAALALQPDEANVLNYLAYSWVEKGMNLTEARTMLEKAVRLRPGDGFILDSLAWAEFALGDDAKAVDLLEQAVMAEPGDPTINEHLGDAYWRTGREMEARYRWQAALDSKPHDDRLAALRGKLDFGLSAMASLAPAR